MQHGPTAQHGPKVRRAAEAAPAGPAPCTAARGRCTCSDATGGVRPRPAAWLHELPPARARPSWEFPHPTRRVRTPARTSGAPAGPTAVRGACVRIGGVRRVSHGRVECASLWKLKEAHSAATSDNATTGPPACEPVTGGATGSDDREERARGRWELSSTRPEYPRSTLGVPSEYPRSTRYVTLRVHAARCICVVCCTCVF